VRPSNQCLTGLINLSVSSPWTDSGGVTGICMKMQPPSSCGMPLVTAAWCGFLRDGIEGRWGLVRRKTFNQRRRRQGKGCSTKTVPGDTSGQGRGLFHPPPRRAASPTGAIPHRRTTTEAGNLSAVDAITLTEIPFPSRAPYPGLSPCTARPLEGGGRRPRERPGGGGWSTARIENRSR
jgi:hypothetical protein